MKDLNARTLATELADLHLPAVRFYQATGSTNDEAITWAEHGAPDWALVVADEQTAGRGRTGRRWITPPGSALAFSLILRPRPAELPYLARATALGALAVCQALFTEYGLDAQVKWPNDVLVSRRQLAGVLAETQWNGAQPTALVLGIGINVATAFLGTEVLNYPATCVAAGLGSVPDRLELLHAVLKAMIDWRPRLGSPSFMSAWENALAYRNQWVLLAPGDGSGAMIEGLVLGLTPDGALRLKNRQDKEIIVNVGELRLAGDLAQTAGE